MATHPAIVTTTASAPLKLQNVPTVVPKSGEVRVRVDWTMTAAFDLHQADGGLLVSHGVLGSCFAGIIVEASPDVDTAKLRIGDKVFGYGFQDQQTRAYQLYVTISAHMCGKIPSNVTPQEAVTVPDSLITAVHTLSYSLRLPLQWPVPASPSPSTKTPILVWGGSSSSGHAILQVLKHWGYTNIIATSSPQHHELLKVLGATKVFDYRDEKIVENIKNAGRSLSGNTQGPAVPLIVDSIGSVSGSLAPISAIASTGTRVAVLLPVLIRAPSVKGPPEYAMDVKLMAKWQDGVEVEGVRTHFYMENEALKERLQSEMLPELVRTGAIRPIRQRLITGSTMLERAESALQAWREGVSGERLVWRVSGEGS
ncbi:hypothetical protein FH972_024695 [Carpinus fangiana]|uniref:Enoyl reductase (ER) domain-containing protein n=1 Tax=Carpinus fangiana TaxID=176857 RepID=A0A5N6KZF2_9ROSI|nr:hypothetical protein FH972_024695 [Carpinus fangiana]